MLPSIIHIGAAALCLGLYAIDPLPLIAGCVLFNIAMAAVHAWIAA